MELLFVTTFVLLASTGAIVLPVDRDPYLFMVAIASGGGGTYGVIELCGPLEAGTSTAPFNPSRSDHTPIHGSLARI